MPLLITIMLLFAGALKAQQYQYIRIITVQAGYEDKAKAAFLMPSMPDSARYYTSMKINDILTAVELMERKGFQLVSITPANSTVGVGALIVTTAYMRRRK